MDPHGRDVLVGLRYGIGDVVMQHPALEALRRALPRARVTAVAAPPATELLDDLRLVDEVVSVARWGISHRWDEGGPGTGGAVHAWLAERRFDLFLDVRHLGEGIGAQQFEARSPGWTSTCSDHKHLGQWLR
jgi:ADP-heptose:LPS heptosyltransferase